METRLKEFRQKMGLTQERVAEDLNIHHITYNRIETGKNRISLDRLQQLAVYFGVDPVALLTARHPTRMITVKSLVQAGHWSETNQWEDGDWYDVAVPDDADLRPYALHAAEARGPSMNKKYPEGTVIVFTSIIETMEELELGKRYIVERESSDGLRESTVKLLHRDDQGKLWLVPESTDPLYQQPIELNGNEGETIRVVGRVRFAVLRE